MSLTTQIMIGMIAGFVVGFGLSFVADVTWVQVYLLDGVLDITGKIFINALKMLVVPLVFVSLVCGASALADPAKLGRVGGKALGLYLLTTGIAVSAALFVAKIFRPGEGANPTAIVERDIPEAPPLSEVITNIVPTNPVAAMANTDMLPIIVFSILVGITLTMTGKSGQRLKQFFDDANEVVMKLVTLVMKIAPYGVFALIAILAATTGWETFRGVAKYMGLVMVVLVLHGLIVYPSLLMIFARLNPIPFLLKMRPAMLFAFTTASSNATIPVTLETVRKRLGVKNSIASFTVPLGATINMDGTAIMQGIATGFIAQYYGIELGIAQYLVIVLMVIMASIGAAGVPSVGLILLAGVLAQVNLPAEGIALILGVDRILDMTRTAVNVTGDAAITTIVARSEGEMDPAVFEDPDAAEDFEAGGATSSLA